MAENSANESRPADTSELSSTDQRHVDQSNLDDTKTPNKIKVSFADYPDIGNPDDVSATNVSATDMQISGSSEQCSYTGNSICNTVTENKTKQEELSTLSTVRPLRQGQKHSADEIYKLIQLQQNIHADVPPGKKSKCYLLNSIPNWIKKRDVNFTTIEEHGKAHREGPPKPPL